MTPHLHKEDMLPFPNVRFRHLSFALLACAVNAGAQSLVIDSPAQGASFPSGGSINVHVATSADISAVKVGVEHGGFSDDLTIPPFQFIVPAPTGRCGPLKITAMGISSGSQAVLSAPITVMIICPIDGSGLKVTPRSVFLNYVGDEATITPSVMRPDGSVFSARAAFRYSTSDPSIAVTDATGTVSATGAGNTNLTVSYGSQSAVVAVKVRTSIPGDLDGDGDVDTDDLAEIQRALNTVVKVPNDGRDLNHDGKIDALDARILTTLCTRPRCAVQ